MTQSKLSYSSKSYIIWSCEFGQRMNVKCWTAMVSEYIILSSHIRRIKSSMLTKHRYLPSKSPRAKACMHMTFIAYNYIVSSLRSPRESDYYTISKFIAEVVSHESLTFIAPAKPKDYMCFHVAVLEGYLD